MTFDEALASLRDPNGNASPEGLALAEQVEANRKAIEELRSELEQAKFGAEGDCGYYRRD